MGVTHTYGDGDSDVQYETPRARPKEALTSVKDTCAKKKTAGLRRTTSGQISIRIHTYQKA